MTGTNRALPRLGLATLAGVVTLLTAASSGAVGASTPNLGTVPSGQAGVAAGSAVVSSRIIGHSVNSHPIRAFELGNPHAALTVVALGAMHGNETGGLVVLGDLRDGKPVKGVHLWVIPRDNPDGVLRHERHNAHGVDLNRNFPTKWKPLTGYYYAGPAPSSEPETRALKRFLNRVDPDYVVTFHSPLQGVDVYGAKDRPFARSLAKHLNLPTKSYNCSGACHGTLTQWFNAHHAGACVTVEFASSPSAGYLHVKAPRGLLHAIGGHF
jgi:murein peptide amidase A